MRTFQSVNSNVYLILVAIDDAPFSDFIAPERKSDNNQTDLHLDHSPITMKNYTRPNRTAKSALTIN